MPLTDIGSTEISDLTNTMTDFSVDSESTDGPADQKETTYTNELFTQYFGYYKKIPELRSSIDAKATWTVGKGYKADEVTTMQLDNIRGWGKDTFNTILENAIRTYHIGGDAFLEIIRDEDGNLINLKPLDPYSIMIVSDRKGIIKRYEQISKVKGTNSKKFKPEEIFHLARNRVADEIHGVSMIESLTKIILMRNEAMDDWQRVMHRNIDPVWIFHLDTDDTSKIDGFKAKMDSARGKGENMYIPKDAVVPEQMGTASNSTLNPLAWIEALNNYFYEAAGVPKIIMGNAQEFTEASAKISYLAFQQTIEEEQLFIEESILHQLGYVISLTFPASLENELLSDKAKDGEMTAAQPNDTTAQPMGEPPR
jgi:hypothetical protein